MRICVCHIYIYINVTYTTSAAELDSETVILWKKSNVKKKYHRVE